MKPVYSLPIVAVLIFSIGPLFEPLQSDTSTAQEKAWAKLDEPNAKQDGAQIKRADVWVERAVDALSGNYVQLTLQSPTQSQLGVFVRKTDEALQAHLQLDDGVGLIIENVIPKSAAEKSKLQRLDILLMLDDQLLINKDQLTTLVRNKKPGDKVELTLIRNGEKKEVDVKLEASTSIASVDGSWHQLKGSVDTWNTDQLLRAHISQAGYKNCSSCHAVSNSFKFDSKAKTKPPVEKKSENKVKD